MDKLIAGFVLLAVAVALAVTLPTRRLLARLFAIYWGGIFLLVSAHYATQPGLLTGKGMLFVAALTGAVSAAVAIVELISPTGKDAKASTQVPLRPLRDRLPVRALLIASALVWIGAIAHPFVHLKAVGFEIADIIQDTQSTIQQIYHSNVRNETPLQIFTIIPFYILPLLAGLHLRARIIPWWLTISLALVPALLLLAFTTQKAVVIFYVVLFIGSWYATSHLDGTPRKPLSRRTSVRITIVLVSLLVVMVGAMVARGHLGGKATLGKFSLYATGHIAAFDRWIDRYTLGEAEPTEVITTFAGPYTILFGGERKAGVYHDQTALADPTLGQLTWTNVYTTWRPLVEDATIPGAVIIIFLASLIAAYVQDRMGRRTTLLSMLAFMFYLAFVVYCACNVTSVFIYSSLLLALVVFPILLFLLFWIRDYFQGRRG